MGRTADAIAEGVAIATAAARLALKNQILVGTIAKGGVFDPERYVADAREALLAMAVESDEAADAMVRLRKRARGRYSDPAGTHDYRDRDVRNLRRRAKQYAGVAKKLRVLAESDADVTRIVEDARDAAWHDVENNIDNRLRIEAMRPDDDPDYAKLREARMESLRLVDLDRLAAEVKAREKRRRSNS